MKALPFALFSLSPLIIGPLPAAAQTVKVGLCNGGSISLTLPAESGRDEAPLPCQAKGCHAGSCRKRFDSAQ